MKPLITFFFIAFFLCSFFIPHFSFLIALCYLLFARRHGCRCYHCFSWIFFAEKNPKLKISTEADFQQ